MNKIKQIKNMDQFSTSYPFNFELEAKVYQENHATWTGFIATVLAVIAIIIFSIGSISNTLSKKTVMVEQSENQFLDGVPLEFSLKESSAFMIGFGIHELEKIKPGKRYFDMGIWTVSYSKLDYVNGSGYGYRNCNSKQWSQLVNQFNDLNMQSLYCIANQQQNISNIVIQGQATSKVFKSLLVQVGSCTNYSTAIPNCSPLSEIYPNTFRMRFSYINTQINPYNHQDYLTRFIKEESFTFAPDSCVDYYLTFQSYTVSTDQSIFGPSNIHNQSGILSHSGIQSYPKSCSEGIFLNIFLQDATSTITYKRSYRQITDLFGTIGGLITSVFAAMFLMRFYNKANLEVQIGNKCLIKKKDDSDEEPINFNFFKWILYSIVPFMCCESFQSDQYKRYRSLREKVQKYSRVQLFLKFNESESTSTIIGEANIDSKKSKNPQVLNSIPKKTQSEEMIQLDKNQIQSARKLRK